MPSDTRAGRYAGPPGDTTAYYLPRDMRAWEASWDQYLGETTPQEALDTSRRRGQGEADMSPEAVAARAEAKRRQAEAIAYVESYRGSWGLPLDIRARKDWGTKHLKLTEGQVDALLKGRDRDLERAAANEAARSDPRHVRAMEVLDLARVSDPGNQFFASLRMQASSKPLTERQIDAVLRQEDRYVPRPSDPGTGLEASQDPQLAPQRPTEPGMVRETIDQRANRMQRERQERFLRGEPASVHAARPDVAEGWYTVDGQPWKVQLNRERTRKYAKRLIARPGQKGEWEYVPGGMALIASKGQRMTVEDAVQYGKLYGTCAVCGATLTNETSIERGIGPICFGRIAL